MGELLWIFVSAALVNNFTLTLFLGLCPFFGVSREIGTAMRMGAANTFVLVITSLVAWVLNTFVLGNAPYLRIIAFIVVIPPARADGPLSVPAGALVFPQGSHIHEGGEEEHHCHLCHENWAARVDEKNLCPRCELHPEERTESGIP